MSKVEIAAQYDKIEVNMGWHGWAMVFIEYFLEMVPSKLSLRG